MTLLFIMVVGFILLIHCFYIELHNVTERTDQYSFVLCSVVKQPGSGGAVETLDFPLHIFRALPLPLSCSKASYQSLLSAMVLRLVSGILLFATELYRRLTSSVISANLSDGELQTVELEVECSKNSRASQSVQKSRSRLWFHEKKGKINEYTSERTNEKSSYHDKKCILITFTIILCRMTYIFHKSAVVLSPFMHISRPHPPSMGSMVAS